MMFKFDRDEFITPFDKLFDKMMVTNFPEITKEVGIDAFQNSAYPKCDIIDFDDRVEIIAEIPGLGKDQITLEIENDVISLKGNKHKHIEKEGGSYLRRELKKSSFVRTFRADSKIFNLDKVKANFVDGLLELIIPKNEKKEPVKKTIKIG